MSSISHRVLKQETAGPLLELMFHHLNQLSHSSHEELEQRGLANLSFDDETVQNTEKWLALLGMSSQRFETLSEDWNSSIKEIKKSFAENSDVVSKVKNLAHQLLELSKETRTAYIQRLIDSVNWAIKTRGSENIYQSREDERSLQRLQSELQEVRSATLGSFEGIATTPI